MKRFLILFFAIIGCVFVGCSKSNDPPEEPIDKVVSFSVSNEFYSETYFVNDIIDLNNYEVVVTYESGKTETVSLSAISTRFLNTNSSGEKTLTLSYKEKTESIKYTVTAITAIKAIYKGEDLSLYYGEDFDFSTINITVLYNNGDEKIISLNKDFLSGIDNSISSGKRTLKVTYENVSANISYTVSCRPIVLNMDYMFDNSLNILRKEAYKVNFSKTTEDNKEKYSIFIFDDRGETIDKVLSQSATKEEDGRMSTKLIVGGSLKKVYFYLANGIIHCEI